MGAWLKPRTTATIGNMETLKDFADRFHETFACEISHLKEDILRISSDVSVQNVYSQVEQLAAGKAKRIRPYVASVLYRDAARCTDDAEVMPALVGLEMFHLFALIHDDIMDDADERYGCATIHCRLRGQEQERLGPDAADRLGRAHAILAGDMLLTQVHALFLRLAGTPGGRESHRLLLTMSREIVTGQHLDLAYTVRPACTEADILQRHHLKTSLYTYVRPMQIGALLGGGSPEAMAFCEAFGTAIGQGFQIEDDLLDLLGDAADTGKKPCADITQRQHTLLTQHIAVHGTAKQCAMLEDMWGKEISGRLLQETRALFLSSGAVDAVRSTAQAAFRRAEEILEEARIQPGTRQVLREHVAFLSRRLP